MKFLSTRDPCACEIHKMHIFQGTFILQTSQETKLAPNRPTCGASFQDCAYAWRVFVRLWPGQQHNLRVCAQKPTRSTLPVPTKKVHAHSPARFCAWAWPATAGCKLMSLYIEKRRADGSFHSIFSDVACNQNCRIRNSFRRRFHQNVHAMIGRILLHNPAIPSTKTLQSKGATCVPFFFRSTVRGLRWIMLVVLISTHPHFTCHKSTFPAKSRVVLVPSEKTRSFQEEV